MAHETQTGDWHDEKKKTTAVYDVLRYLARNPERARQLIGQDEEARQLFETEGRIKVPTSARVIFFPREEGEGEDCLNLGSSVILRVPPPGYENATDEQLEDFVLGNYPYWPPVRD